MGLFQHVTDQDHVAHLDHVTCLHTVGAFGPGFCLWVHWSHVIYDLYQVDVLLWPWF